VVDRSVTGNLIRNPIFLAEDIYYFGSFPVLGYPQMSWVWQMCISGPQEATKCPWNGTYLFQHPSFYAIGFCYLNLMFAFVQVVLYTDWTVVHVGAYKHSWYNNILTHLIRLDWMMEIILTYLPIILLAVFVICLNLVEINIIPMFGLDFVSSLYGLWPWNRDSVRQP